MLNNSTELLDYALRKLQAAIEKDEQKIKIEIELSSKFKIKKEEIKDISDSLEIITEEIRKKLDDYEINSIVSFSNNMNFSFILCHLDAPCDFYYPLVWTLTIKKKEA